MFRFKKISVAELRENPSALLLILLNLVTIFGAIVLNWSLFQIVLSYWAETAIIGFFNLLKMWKAEGKLALENSTGPLDPPPIPTKPSLFRSNPPFFRMFLIVFFCMHFGGFLLGHLIFTFIVFNGELVPEGVNHSVDYTLIISIICFIIIHGYSYKKNYIQKEEYKRIHARKLLLAPYGRIFLAHFFIMVSAIIISIFATSNQYIFQSTIILLVFLKIFIDTNAHLKEREKNSAASIDTKDANREFMSKFFR